MGKFDGIAISLQCSVRQQAGSQKAGSIYRESCTGRERAQDGAFDHYFREINPQSLLLLNYSSIGKF